MRFVEVVRDAEAQYPVILIRLTGEPSTWLFPIVKSQVSTAGMTRRDTNLGQSWYAWQSKVVVVQVTSTTHLMFLPRKISSLGILSVSSKNPFNLAFIRTLCSY